MNNMSKQEEEEEKISNLYAKSSSSSSNKRKRNQSSSSSSNKRKRNHLTSLNRNKRRNKKMFNYTTREQHHNKSSSSSSSKNNDDVYKAIRYVRKRKMNCDQDTILSKNKRNNPGKAKATQEDNAGAEILSSSAESFVHARKSNVLNFEGSVAVVLKTVPDGSLVEKELSLWTPIAVSGEVVWNKMFTFGTGSEEIDWLFLYSGANQFFGKTRLGEMLYDYRKKQTKYVEFPSQSFLLGVLSHTESFLPAEGLEGFNES
ncbi:uncharacterized protein LOC141703729 [Apium graveolens]